MPSCDLRTAVCPTSQNLIRTNRPMKCLTCRVAALVAIRAIGVRSRAYLSGERRGIGLRRPRSASALLASPEIVTFLSPRCWSACQCAQGEQGDVVFVGGAGELAENFHRGDRAEVRRQGRSGVAELILAVVGDCRCGFRRGRRCRTAACCLPVGRGCGWCEVRGRTPSSGSRPVSCSTVPSA